MTMIAQSIPQTLVPQEPKVVTGGDLVMAVFHKVGIAIVPESGLHLIFGAAAGKYGGVWSCFSMSYKESLNRGLTYVIKCMIHQKVISWTGPDYEMILVGEDILGDCRTKFNELNSDLQAQVERVAEHVKNAHGFSH